MAAAAGCSSSSTSTAASTSSSELRSPAPWSPTPASSCDEPLSNLDAGLRERMRVEISALVRGAAATTIYITGLSGELPVRIRPVEAGFVEVEPPGANGARPLRLRAPAAPGAGPPALLMIRPTGVRLVSELGDEHHLPGSWPTLRSVAGATSTPSTFPGPAGSPGCSPRRARLGGNRSGSGSSPAAATSSRARLRGL
jgi:hypothetical protein